MTGFFCHSINILKVLDVRLLRACAATTSLRPFPIGTSKFLHSGFGFFPISTGKFYYGYTGCEMAGLTEILRELSKPNYQNQL